MARLYTFSIAVVFWCGASTSALRPQSQGDAQALRIKTQTDLVQIPVVAHRGGKHIEGLKVDDFTVLVDGKPRTIEFFEEVRPKIPSKAAATDEFTNIPGTDRSTAEQVTIIAIDLSSTAPLDQAYLKDEIIKFLDLAAKTGEPFALVAITRSGIRVLHDFTTDPKAIAEAVKGQPLQIATREAAGGTILDSRPCARSPGGCGGGTNAEAGLKQLESWITLMTNQEKFEIYRDRVTGIETLVALQQLAQSLRGLPGRKILIWASSGTRLFGGMSRMFSGNKDLRGGASIDTSRVGEALDQNAHTFSLLSVANIAVYPLDARHGANTSFADYDVKYSDSPLTEAVEATRASNNEIIDSFKAIAEATGGKPCFNRTDLANCLQEAAEDSRNYYMLGIYLEKNTKPGWHPIGVKLGGPRADLSYRHGFLYANIDPEKSKLTDLQLAMMSPVNYTAVPFRGRFDSPVDKGDKKVIGFAVDLPAGAVLQNPEDTRLALDIAAVVRGVGGKEITRIAQRIDRTLTPEQANGIRAKGMRYTNRLEVPPGDYGVWIVVRESTSGRTGSVVTTVSAK